MSRCLCSDAYVAYPSSAQRDASRHRRYNHRGAALLRPARRYSSFVIVELFDLASFCQNAPDGSHLAWPAEIPAHDIDLALPQRRPAKLDLAQPAMRMQFSPRVFNLRLSELTIARKNKKQRGEPRRSSFLVLNCARAASVVQEAPELSGARGVLELAQRLRLDLADALARHAELLADLLERVVGVHADAEAHAQHALLARRQ